MKINKYIGIIVLASFQFLTSCSDYLETSSLSSFDSNYVFSSADDTKKAVLGVYSMFAQDSYTSRMSNVWMQNTDVEVQAPGASPDGSRRDLWSLQAGLLTGFKDIKTAWDHNYLAINRANRCIEGIQSSPVANTPEMKMLLGESYCLRAYRYFLLCNFWGDVPYFRESAKAEMVLDIPKTDKNIIYSGMIQDLVNAEPDMLFSGEFSNGIERMNREFAIGMISRLSMFRAGYGMTASGETKRADDYLDVANDESLAVTYSVNGQTKVARTSTEYYQLAKDYALKLVELRDRALPDYAKVFENENKWVTPADEDVLYEVAFGATNGGGDVGWCIGVPVTGGTFGKTTIQVGFSPAYYFSFDQKDKRRDVTITKVSYSSETEQNALSSTALGVGKWNRLLLKAAPGENSSKGTGINWPLMRYSDVLLMLAEADNEINNGPTALAKEMLKRVRTRAFDAADVTDKVDTYISTIGNDKTAFFNAIVDERAWEFGGECLRRFDLIRWNNYGKKIVETKTTLDNMGKAAYDIELDNPEVAKYSNLAKKLYYRKVGGKIVWLNTYFNPEIIPEKVVIVEDLDKPGNENAYASIGWGTSLYKKITAIDGTITYETADYTARCWRGYLDPTGINPVPFTVPISSETINTSQYLNNDGYGLVKTN